VYEGELQVEPQFGGDVKVVEGGVAEAPRRDIGSISGADEGQRVTIEGEIVRVEGLSSAVKVFLRDKGDRGQGEIVVFIWRNVLDRIANNAGLGTEGSRVRVTGTVQVYRSNLEVVPALPNDVTVLERP
jgi:DNA/RNA endonuclease YhcR with UshA esterase domain